MPKDSFSKMGLTRRPIFELFGGSNEIAQDPAYAPAARQAALEDLAVQSNQRAFDMAQRDLRQQDRAQRAVGQYLRQPSSTRQQFLEDNPAVALSPQYGAIDRYEDNIARNKAARTLAPSLARKLPPVAAQRFYSNIDSGMGANEAFEEARDFDEQEGFRARLAPYASDEEIKMRFPNGRFTAPEVARFEYEQKKKAGDDPQLETLRDYYSTLSKQANTLASVGKSDPELEEKMARTLANIEDRVQQRLKPAVAPASAPVDHGDNTPPPPLPAAEAAPADKGMEAPKPAAGAAAKPMSYMELLRSTSPEAKKQEAEKAQINEQWTKAKQDIEKKLDAVVPDRVVGSTGINQREAFARAIMDGEEIPVEGVAPVEGAGPITEPLATAILRQMGLVPADTAFEESGNQRTGSQAISNRELLNAWAEDFLRQRKTKEKEGRGLTPQVEADMERILEEAIGSGKK